MGELLPIVLMFVAVVVAGIGVAAERANKRAVQRQLARMTNDFHAAQRIADMWQAMFEREREARDVATNRLVAAWKDGYTVPHADAMKDEPVTPPAKLDLPLVEWLNQWEEPVARARFEAIITRKLGEGRAPDAVLADMELMIAGGQENLLTPQPSPVIQVGARGYGG